MFSGSVFSGFGFWVSKFGYFGFQFRFSGISGFVCLRARPPRCLPAVIEAILLGKPFFLFPFPFPLPERYPNRRRHLDLGPGCRNQGSWAWLSVSPSPPIPVPASGLLPESPRIPEFGIRMQKSGLMDSWLSVSPSPPLPVPAF